MNNGRAKITKRMCFFCGKDTKHYSKVVPRFVESRWADREGTYIFTHEHICSVCKGKTKE